ncbi:hypothetical protein D3C85_805570 [compost metagenome]
MAGGKQGQAFEGGIRQLEPGLGNTRCTSTVVAAKSQPRIAQQLDQAHPVAETPVLPVRSNGWQIPVRSVVAVVGLAQLAQQVQRITQQLLKILQQLRQGRCPLLVCKVAEGRMHVIGGQHQFPIHQLPQARGFVRALFFLAPAKRLRQGHLGGKQLAQLQAQRGGQPIPFQPTFPAIEIGIVPRGFPPPAKQQTPQRAHQGAGNGPGCL